MITIIIPVYDRTMQLKQSIDSILCQTYKDIEIIIVTDGSPPETLKVLKEYENNIKIRIFYYLDNTGNAVRGRNKGVKEAKGEFVAFHDSDDIAELNRLELSIEYMKKYCVDVVYGGWRVILENRTDLDVVDGQEIMCPECDLEKLKQVCVLCNSTVMVRLSALLNVGGLKPKMEYMEDYELWLRLAYFGSKFKFVPHVLTNLRLHEQNNELKFKKDYKKWHEISKNEFIVKSSLPMKIAYIIPGTGISGGIAVILQHTNRLLQLGYDVFLITQDMICEIDWFPNKVKIVPINIEKKYLENIDVLVATGWNTVKEFDKIQAKRKIYFVQSDERRFFDDFVTKNKIHNTYTYNCDYMTEAKWIKEWLKKEFQHDCYYVPNGLDEKIFFHVPKQKTNKCRVLIEGPICIPFKGVETAYNVVKDLDCEIWFVSSSGKPKKNWRYDKFFEFVKMENMKEIYSSCDILIKMSKVEGFFGPPMEAMACGCSVVVSKCTGYDEYIVDGYNALVVEQDDVLSAKKAVDSILKNKNIKNKLIKNGFNTAKNWKWDRSIEHLIAAIQQKKIEKPLEIDCVEKCDIIIVVHNSVSFVKLCISSIKKYTDFPYNLIIVDNASNEETKNYLRTLSDTTIITNLKNFGFGYANNLAIQASNSEYVCFLNSDTIVTKNWLSRFIEILDSNNAGIVGPITNCISSEIQQINFPHQYPNNDDFIQEFSEERFNQHKNEIIETNRLIGFCMLTTRKALNIFGVFDDRYEFNFEDDDLCLRAIEAGYKLFCANGIFIYHFGSQTFKDKFKTITHTPTLEKSRNLYNQKWYETNRIKSIYENHNKFSILYLLASDSPSGGVKIVFEQANRLKERGHDVKIYCIQNQINVSWFKTKIPIIYSPDSIPETDIAIGTYFSTLPILQKLKSPVKIHLSQGYEALLYNDEAVLTTIKSNYNLIPTKIVVSKWLKEILDKEYNIDSIYVPNGIDQYMFSFKKHARNQIPRILLTGNYNLEIKGVRIALIALKQYLTKFKGTIVRLASEKAQQDEEFEFHDMSKMTQLEIAKVYESCDVTVCASYKVEGFSLHPLESMASGTPVLSTDNGGINDYAINGQNAMIIQTCDVHAIQHTLGILLSNSYLYDRLIERGLETANRYLWYRQIDMLETNLAMLYQKQIDESREKLSLCMIVKNEQEFLDDCLGSVKDLVSEIVIVDTGSTDDTIKIAKKYGAKIYHYVWNDDFSAARNFALGKVTQPWVLILDADERIAKRDHKKLRELLKKQCAYNFVTRNYVKIKDVDDIMLCKGDYKEEKDYVGWCCSEKVRLFPYVAEIGFEGQVHELVENSLNRLSVLIEETDIPIHHYGQTKRKDKTYLKLGLDKLSNNHDDKKAMYELAIQYLALNNYDEALVLWRRLLVLEPKSDDYLSKLGTTYNLLENYEEAERCFLGALNVRETDYSYKHLAICYAKQERIKEAYEIFKRIVYKTEDLKTLADFAHCCNCLKKFDESILVLEKCLKLNKRETLSLGLLEIAYNEKGIELVNKKRYPQAMNMFKSAVSINSSFDIARSNISELNKLMRAVF